MAFGLSAGAVAAIGSVGGALIGAGASSSAAKKQQRAAENANALQRKQTDQAIDMQQPFYQGGVQAQNKLMELMGFDPGYDQAEYDRIYQGMRDAESEKHRAAYGFGFDNAPGWADPDIAAAENYLKRAAMDQAKALYAQNPKARSNEFGSLLKDFSMEDFEADPGYQFRMDEGMRGVEGGAAARGGLLSGAALKAIQKYGQGLASQEYANAYNRFNANQTNKFNKLTGLVQSGKGSAQQITNAGQNYATTAGDNIIGAGNAEAAGIMGGTNALVGGINQGINAYQQNQLMNLIRQPSNSGWGGSAGRWGNGTVDALGDGVWG